MTIFSCLDARADRTELRGRLEKLAATFDGRIGICISELGSSDPTCVRGHEPFPLQSVMKLVVAAAVMDLADRGQLELSEVLVVKPEDASPGPQEFANLVRSQSSLSVTMEELIRRAIVDSDSTSVDILIERIGGVRVVQKFLREKKIEGIRIGRNERDLQAETVGLAWCVEFSDSVKFDAAINQLPEVVRDAAWHASLRDLRDTATPMGMVQFLKMLASGALLSAPSTQALLAVMEKTATGLDRLRAGIPTDWTIAHKTGTGREWKGVVSATNDVGVLTAPGGGQIAVAVFLSESRHSTQEGAALIASIAKCVTQSYLARARTKTR